MYEELTNMICDINKEIDSKRERMEELYRDKSHLDCRTERLELITQRIAFMQIEFISLVDTGYILQSLGGKQEEYPQTEIVRDCIVERIEEILKVLEMELKRGRKKITCLCESRSFACDEELSVLLAKKVKDFNSKFIYF